MTSPTKKPKPNFFSVQTEDLPSLQGVGWLTSTIDFLSKFSLETRLKSKSFEPLIGCLTFLGQKLLPKNNKLIVLIRALINFVVFRCISVFLTVPIQLIQTMYVIISIIYLMLIFSK